MASASPKDLDIDGEQQAGDPSSPPFNDLDSFLLDFDPVMEWLVDPDLDLTISTASEETAIPSPGALDHAPIRGEEPAALSIDEKMDKISLAAREPTDKPDAGPEAAATAAKVQNDGAIDVCLINDPIKVAHVSEEESGGSETESSSSDEDDSSSSDESSSSSSDEDSGRFDARRMEGGRGDEMEEGEIRDNTLEEVAAAFSDGDEDVVVGPIRSKHEAEVLPPVPQVQVSLQQHHQPLPVGAILSIVGTRIIVEGLEKHSPLNEGSVLWITESRSPLGLIDETFGPVKSPYYIVRHNSEEDVPVGINVGTAVSYVMEFANCILNEKELYKKGYDASGENDEEATDEVEFSDDEKEAEYKRSLRQTKRATNDMWHRNQETEIDKWANFRGSPSSSRWHKKPESAPDKRMSKFMGGTANDRWQRGSQDSIIDKRTSVKGTVANDRWQRNQESATDKRANFTDTSIEKHVQPHVFSVPPDQPLSHVPSFGPNIGSGSSTSVGSGNAFVNNQAITPDLLQALQLGNFFSNPSQQLLLQQANALLGNGFLPLQHLGIQGGGQMNSLPSQHAGNTTFNQQQRNQQMNSLPSQHAGNTTFNQHQHNQQRHNQQQQNQQQHNQQQQNQQQHNQQLQNQQQQNQQQQNYLFNCLANALPFQQQFIPNLGAPTNFPWFGGPPNLSVGSTPFEAARQPNASHAPFGFSNVHGQGTSVPTNAQSYGLPPSEFTQGMTHTMQFNPSIGPTSLGPMGQPNLGQASSMSTNMPNKWQEEGASVSNGQSHGQPTSGILGGDLRPPMQCNPSIFPASIGQAPSECTNMPEKGHGILDPCNAHSYGQPLPLTSQGGMHPIQSHPSIDPRLLGSVQQSSVNQTQFGCSDMQEQGSSGSPNLQAYGQSNPSINQGIMRPPMQFNSSSGPCYTGTIGQTNVGQVPFGCSNMEQRPSGSFPHNYKQPSTSIDQRPRTQFNPGRSSSFRGRKQHPRGRHSFRGGV